jgi:8-amino-7-oxononanoate synthase
LRDALARLPLRPPLPVHEGPIHPLVVGPDHTAVTLARNLADRGFFVPAVRPPTVPEGTARLRVTVSAAHTETDVADFADALGSVL